MLKDEGAKDVKDRGILRGLLERFGLVESQSTPQIEEIARAIARDLPTLQQEADREERARLRRETWAALQSAEAAQAAECGAAQALLREVEAEVEELKREVERRSAPLIGLQQRIAYLSDRHGRRVANLREKFRRLAPAVIAEAEGELRRLLGESERFLRVKTFLVESQSFRFPGKEKRKFTNGNDLGRYRADLLAALRKVRALADEFLDPEDLAARIAGIREEVRPPSEEIPLPADFRRWEEVEAEEEEIRERLNAEAEAAYRAGALR